jgi:hypothetical protein
MGEDVLKGLGGFRGNVVEPMKVGRGAGAVDGRDRSLPIPCGCVGGGGDVKWDIHQKRCLRLCGE